MYGYWYSVKQHFSFSREELKELFWTSLAFAFVLTSYYQSLFVIEGDVRIVISDTLLAFFLLVLMAVFLSLYFHITLQKLIGIRLGYKVNYSYWLNGILIGLFISVVTLGKIPLLSVFILPGAVNIEHIPTLRLGKFRYGTNAKDIARVSLAGPISHIIIATMLGMVYYSTGKSPFIFTLISANLLLMIYSILPIPKIDFPTKMDSASDGLGLFFYSRSVYLLCAITVLFYCVLVWAASVFSFVLAFGLALVSLLVYAVAIQQPT
ncbi:MAG: hypothetical protein ACP5NW_02860 [Candidatus Woesearchaeota archaeon]